MRTFRSFYGKSPLTEADRIVVKLYFQRKKILHPYNREHSKNPVRHFTELRIILMRSKGFTYTHIAKRSGLSLERIRQIETAIGRGIYRRKNNFYNILKGLEQSL